MASRPPACARVQLAHVNGRDVAGFKLFRPHTFYTQQQGWQDLLSRDCTVEEMCRQLADGLAASFVHPGIQPAPHLPHAESDEPATQSGPQQPQAAAEPRRGCWREWPAGSGQFCATLSEHAVSRAEVALPGAGQIPLEAAIAAPHTPDTCYCCFHPAHLLQLPPSPPAGWVCAEACCLTCTQGRIKVLPPAPTAASQGGGSRAMSVSAAASLWQVRDEHGEASLQLPQHFLLGNQVRSASALLGALPASWGLETTAAQLRKARHAISAPGSARPASRCAAQVAAGDVLVVRPAGVGRVTAEVWGAASQQARALAAAASGSGGEAGSEGSPQQDEQNGVDVDFTSSDQTMASEGWEDEWDDDDDEEEEEEGEEWEERDEALEEEGERFQQRQHPCHWCEYPAGSRQYCVEVSRRTLEKRVIGVPGGAPPVAAPLHICLLT